MMVGIEPVGPCTGAKRIEQDHLQIAAMNRELRMVVAGRAPQRLLIDQLAEAIEEGRIAGFACDFRQRRFKTAACKFYGGMRQQIDAEADRTELGSRFKNTAGNAALL